MKGLLSAILTIIMFFASLLTVGLVTVRVTFSGDTMTKLVESAFEEMEVSTDYDDLFEEALGQEYDPEMVEYFDDEKFGKELSVFAKDFMEYVLGASNKEPSTDEIREVLNEAIDKYEDKTGENVDSEELDKFFDEFEKELGEVEVLEGEAKEVTSTLFSNSLLITSVVVILLCAFGIYIITKDIKKSTRRVGIISIIDGALVGSFGMLLSKIASESTGTEESLLDILNTLFDTFKYIGLSFIVIGIALVVIAPLTEKMFASFRKSNDAISNLDNSILDKKHK